MLATVRQSRLTSGKMRRSLLSTPPLPAATLVMAGAFAFHVMSTGLE